MVIWLNGAFVEGDAARVSALDAGLQHGVGLFETMQARHGRVFRLADHLDRLAESAAELGLADLGTGNPDPALFGYTMEQVLRRLALTVPRP
jgi:branched-subunit amino acid aminotransferase/4-amino-4-deoxychorismate lyase